MNSLVARIQNLETSIALIHQRLDEFQSSSAPRNSESDDSISSDSEETNSINENPCVNIYDFKKTSKRDRSESSESISSDSKEEKDAIDGDLRLKNATIKKTRIEASADYSQERFLPGAVGGKARLKDIQAIFTQVLPPDNPNEEFIISNRSKLECIIRPNSWVTQSYFMYKFRQVCPHPKSIKKVNAWFGHCRRKWQGNEITQRETSKPGIYVWQRGKRDSLIRYNP